MGGKLLEIVWVYMLASRASHALYGVDCPTLPTVPHAPYGTAVVYVFVCRTDQHLAVCRDG